LIPLTEREAPAPFEPERAWQLHPQVALRPEAFGALAYHYGNRRLLFLKSPTLVELVNALADHPTATDAVAAVVAEPERPTYVRALARLAASEVIDAR
jgi:putative mycofactocin binding protein MftB